jgi:hypothetical protein
MMVLGKAQTLACSQTGSHPPLKLEDPDPDGFVLKPTAFFELLA